MQRSGTGSQMKIGFGAYGLMRFRLRRIDVVKDMHLEGEQMR
jgi:hypothetical protein